MLLTITIFLFVIAIVAVDEYNRKFENYALGEEWDFLRPHNIKNR